MAFAIVVQIMIVLEYQITAQMELANVGYIANVQDYLIHVIMELVNVE